MANPCTYVVFGATGNLSMTKLMPAFYHLDKHGRLQQDVKIVAIGRRDWTRAEWLEKVREAILPKARGGIEDSVCERFCERLEYFKMDILEEQEYLSLNSFLKSNGLSRNLAFYLSLGPDQFAPAVECLGKAGMLEEKDGWKRVVVEKPFGYDVESARHLQKRLNKYLKEEQTYRIDHYLGKGMVQNVMVFRFANIMMEPLWNRNYIDHIQITHAEDRPIGTRAGYYDTSGAMRDMIQSHLLQVLALIAMEPPASRDAEDLRDEKVKLLKSIRPIPKNMVHAHAYRAQYSEGTVNGENVPAYLQEPGVTPNSVTETYAALKLYIDNWRWAGVPFYIQTGKNMPKNRTIVAVRFKYPPKQFFRESQVKKMEPNWIVFGIQPEESIRIELTAKQPGLEIRTEQTSLDATLKGDDQNSYDAYEELLLDVIMGDRSLFLRYDEVKAAWNVVDPVLQAWMSETAYIDTYPSGTWGPEGSKNLFDHPEQCWRFHYTPECKK